MRFVPRIWSGAALALALALTPAVFAQSDALRAAINLFERQEYAAAQEALLKVERDRLTDDERARLDGLLAEVPEAINSYTKAAQDLGDADGAYERGEWKTADRLYQTVEENKYAPTAGREHATLQRERIAEKMKLAEAAKPTGTVEETVTIETREETPPREQVASEEETGTATTLEALETTSEEGPQRLTPTGQLRMRDELLWQRALAQAEALASKARTAIGDNNFDEARKLTDSALQTIEVAARYAEPISKYEAARQEMLRLKQEVSQAKDDYDRVQAGKEQTEIRDRIKKRRDLIEEQKRESVEQLFNSAEQLRRERRFPEASEVLRQIIRIDPANAKARYQLEVAEDYESFDSQRQSERDRHGEQRRALDKADEALIPWDYDILYPKNWLELTAQRKVTGIGIGQKIEDVELNRKLDEVMPDVDFEDTSFEEVVSFLKDLTKLNIDPLWADLDARLLNPARETTVSLHLKNVSLRRILTRVLKELGGETELAFQVSDGLVLIATKDTLDKEKRTRLYDVRDLVIEMPNIGRPEFSQQNQGLGQSGQSGGGGSVFGQTQQTQQQGQAVPGAGIERLKEIIRGTVEPDSWVDAGAGPGGATITDLNNQLIIFQTSRGHEGVVNLLNELRETQSLQISVEARFLDVVANFLEQFGVDLDFVFNSGSAGYDRAPNLSDPFTGAPVLIPRQYSRIGSIPATPTFGQPMTAAGVPGQPYGQAGLVPSSGGIIPQISEMTPISMQQSSASLVEPSAINTNVPNSFSQLSSVQPALNIVGSFLDNLQVDFLIRATQASRRSSIAQAPRAVLQNAQAVQIQIEGYRRYVSTLEPVVGENAALPRPIPADAVSGTQMWVQGVVSADRRYTTLTIQLLQQGEPSFDRYELQRGSGNSPSIFLLLPIQTRIQFMTTVSVPDGGTVLLGGFKQVGEVELEAGVPILSKIPVLKRAFTNQTTVKDTRTLLILVKSKILIQKEAEEDAFPTFSRGSN